MDKCECKDCGFVEEFDGYWDVDVFMESFGVNGCGECGSFNCEFSEEN